MTTLREAAQQALEGLEKWQWDKDPRGADAYITALRAALAQQAEPVQEQDAELSAALGWPGGISNPVLDRKVLLQKVAALMQDKLWEDHRVRHLWDHTLAQQAEPVDTDCHTQGICQRSGYGIGKQAEPLEPVAWMHNILEDNIIRHRPADLKRSPQNWTPLYNCAQPRQTDPQIADRLARHGIPKP